MNKWNLNGGFGLVQPDRWWVIRNAGIGFGGGEVRNGDGLRIGRGMGANGNAQFLNFWSVFGGVGYQFRSFSDLDTRGGPPIVSPAGVDWNVGVNTDSRKTWGVSLFAGGIRDSEGGYNRNVSSNLRLQPSARVQLFLGARYNYGLTVAQWIANRDVTGDGAIDHVFGSLDFDVIDVTGRGTFAFSPDLTLEMFLQPFVSVGRYSDIRRLARPSSFEFEPVTISTNPDFSNKSVRSNFVLRWEYSSGSTLYLVWQASGRDSSRPGDFDAWRDFGDSFSGDRSNIFMVKTTYWLGSRPAFLRR